MCFYLSEQLTDNILKVLISHGQQLKHIALIECPLITDQVINFKKYISFLLFLCKSNFKKKSFFKGVISLTINQKHLSKIELRGLKKVTSLCLKHVISPFLISVDLSGCIQVNFLIFNFN